MKGFLRSARLLFVSTDTTRVFEPGNPPSRLLSILPEHIHNIQDSADVEDLIARTFLAIHPVLGLNNISLYQIDAQDDRRLHLIATKGSVEDFVKATFSTIDMQQPLFSIDDIASQPVYIPDCKQDERPEEELVDEAALRTLIHCQLSITNDTQGTLSAGTYAQEGLVRLSPEEVAYFGAIAKAVSLAMKHLNSWTLSMQDPLTGVANRRGLEARFDQLARLAKRNQAKISVIYIDINDFKIVNDQFGHAAGDDFLLRFAHWLTANVRDSDVIARIGGDEFALVLPDTDGLHGQIFMDKLAENALQLSLQESPRGISFAQGMGLFPDHGGTLAEVLAYADGHMYQQKRARKKHG